MQHSSNMHLSAACRKYTFEKKEQRTAREKQPEKKYNMPPCSMECRKSIIHIQ